MSVSQERASYKLLALADAQLLRECEVDLYRASGPGGQKRNKTSSAVRLRHTQTGLSVIAREDRSQHVNKRRAIRRMRLAIALHCREKTDPERFSPSELLASCLTRDGRLCVGPRDVRYPAAVCEILDLFLACGMQVRSTAVMLGMTTAALVKFLARDVKLLKEVNRMRMQHELKPLR